jgi:hypothetical protein
MMIISKTGERAIRLRVDEAACQAIEDELSTEDGARPVYEAALRKLALDPDAYEVGQEWQSGRRYELRLVKRDDAT